MEKNNKVRFPLKRHCRNCGNPSFKILCYKCKKIRKNTKALYDPTKYHYFPLKATQLHKDLKGKKGNYKIINLPKLSQKEYQDLVSSVIDKVLGHERDGKE